MTNTSRMSLVILLVLTCVLAKFIFYSHPNSPEPKIGWIVFEYDPIAYAESLGEDHFEVDEQGRKIARFTYSRPWELQFSCVRRSDTVEEKYADLLVNGTPEQQFTAARWLWKGHSRRYAEDVVNFLTASSNDSDEFRRFHESVQMSLEPDAIARELESGDYRWGTWLACLRPHEQLLPSLKKGFKEQPAYYREFILALGHSRDPRVFKFLISLLNSDYAEYAAQALWYFNSPEAEPALVKALENHSPLVAANVAQALGRVGSQQSVPALENLLDREYPGVINVRGAAERAIEEIKKREE